MPRRFVSVGDDLTLPDDVIVADGNLPARLSDGQLSATILDKIKTDSVPRWKASTAYSAGDKVLNPSGDIVSAKANFTSGASYNAANWSGSPSYLQVSEGPYPVSRENVDLTGATDSTAGMTAAFAKLPAGGGGAILIPPGSRIKHAGLSISGKSGFSIIGDGAELRATTTTTPYLQFLNCSDFQVKGVMSGGQSATTRQGPTRGFSFEHCSDFQVDNISARDTEGVGVYLEFCSDGQFGNVKIRNTYADGMHMTRGTKRIQVNGVQARETGDDAVAVVSYNTNGDEICSDITVMNANSYHSKSRGLACVGGQRIRYIGGSVVQPKNAGVYIAQESSYSTYGVTDALIQGIDIQEANTYDTPTINYGGVHIAASTKSLINNVRILDCVVRASAWRSMFLSGTDITLGRNRIYGGTDGINSDNIHNLSLIGNYIYGTAQWGMFLGTLGTGFLNVIDNIIEECNTASVAGADAIYTGAASYAGGGIINQNTIIDASSRLEQGIQAMSTGLIIGTNQLNNRPMSVPATASELRMGAKVRVDGGFGLGKTGQPRQTVPAAATDLTTAIALANALRTNEITFGFAQ
ncbi:glycosidase [Arthrobacter phage Peas]|uniref:Glycosidase n=1 Tax=Arthrobacter phage Peas TaxID=2419965 RepID=A0A3G2KI96_9CAUD|nr:tail protein [Arthrobacter phage Peas]AYN58716.1 glycosidase [Arthrobacter phage Peas]